MPLRNYTTLIDVDKTLGQIRTILRNHDAKSILEDYEGKRLTGLSFRVDTATGVRPFSLPIRVEKTRAVLVRQVESGEINTRRKGKEFFTSYEHAERVAWRILKDWLDYEMALVETEMVEMDEVFMAWLRLGPELNLYQHMVDSGYAQLALDVGGE